MKRKIFFLAVIIVFIIAMIPVSFINADPAIPGTSLNLYQGAGVSSDSYVKFGQYGGEDILWRVLRQDDGTKGVLLISEEILIMHVQYSATSKYWEDSNVRSLLNGSFLDGFSNADKSYIMPFSTTATTIDDIFIPTIGNMTASPFNSSIAADPKRVALYGSSAEKYWTRTPSGSSTAVNYVEKDGSLVGANHINIFGYGVRPMLYLITRLSFSGSGTIDDPYMIAPSTAGTKKKVWVRTMPMTCWQVWINEDNNFQFIFWYPYKDKNWVRIYDMEGNMVYEVDVPLDDPNIIVDLPDGFYTVKTFHDQEMLQEFLIGKP